MGGSLKHFLKIVLGMLNEFVIYYLQKHKKILASFLAISDQSGFKTGWLKIPIDLISEEGKT